MLAFWLLTSPSGAGAELSADAEVGVQLLQTNAHLKNHLPGVDHACSAGYGPGMHIVQLPDIQRQFLLLVPPELVTRSKHPYLFKKYP